MTIPPGEDIIFLENTNVCEKTHALSQWDYHLTLIPSDGQGFNRWTKQLSPVTGKWCRSYTGKDQGMLHWISV